MRMEKADILENVVKYMQTSHTTPSQMTSHDSQFRLGYMQCVREVTGVLEHLCGANSQVVHSMSHFLNIKVAQMTSPHFTSAPTTATAAHATPTHMTSRDDHVQASKLFRHDDVTSPTSMFEPLKNNNSRTNSLHHHHSSAFQKVKTHPQHEEKPAPPSHAPPPHATHKTQTKTNIPKTSSSDNISIAVYQYNHYNNYRNDKQTTNSNANSNANSNTHAHSNINIRPPLIKVEAQASQHGQSDVIVDKLDDSCDDDSMWRPW